MPWPQAVPSTSVGTACGRGTADGLAGTASQGSLSAAFGFEQAMPSMTLESLTVQVSACQSSQNVLHARGTLLPPLSEQAAESHTPQWQSVPRCPAPVPAMQLFRVEA